MLIEKKIAANDVVSFRILTGEEIIGKCIEITDKTITVSKPIVAQIQMVAPNQAGITFGPFMATADEETTKFTFHLDKLVANPIKPRDDIRKQYTKMTSGIEVVSAADGLLKV